MANDLLYVSDLSILIDAVITCIKQHEMEHAQKCIAIALEAQRQADYTSRTKAISEINKNMITLKNKLTNLIILIDEMPADVRPQAKRQILDPIADECNREISEYRAEKKRRSRPSDCD